MRTKLNILFILYSFNNKYRITITHSMSEKDAKYLKSELEKAIPAKEIIVTNAGCVIFSHCGPNTVGIIYIKTASPNGEALIFSFDTFKAPLVSQYF